MHDPEALARYQVEKNISIQHLWGKERNKEKNEVCFFDTDTRITFQKSLSYDGKSHAGRCGEAKNCHLRMQKKKVRVSTC